jgi:DNA polymerase III subunit delta'
MTLTQLAEHQPAARLFQKSLEGGRMAHSYLFAGQNIAELETAALVLAQTINCAKPVGRSATGLGLSNCDRCPSCLKIARASHPDVQWVRPESKLRIITIDQMREVMREIHLKPLEALYKVAIMVEADRLNEQAANAFLKTLEEPPANSVLVLLSTQPERLMETILSRCLRLKFSGAEGPPADPHLVAWVKTFGEQAAQGEKSLLGRYRLLGKLQAQLSQVRGDIEKDLTARSPLEQYEDAESQLRGKWEEELAAAIEAEYRRRRGALLLGLNWWLRDVWIATLVPDTTFLGYPQFANLTQTVAGRLTARDAMENLRLLGQTLQLLDSNVQEALTLEVGLLRLKL